MKIKVKSIVNDLDTISLDCIAVKVIGNNIYANSLVGVTI